MRILSLARAATVAVLVSGVVVGVSAAAANAQRATGSPLRTAVLCSRQGLRR